MLKTVVRFQNQKKEQQKRKKQKQKTQKNNAKN